MYPRRRLYWKILGRLSNWQTWSRCCESVYLRKETAKQFAKDYKVDHFTTDMEAAISHPEPIGRHPTQLCP